MDTQSVSSVAVIRVLVFAKSMHRFGTLRGRMLRGNWLIRFTWKMAVEPVYV